MKLYSLTDISANEISLPDMTSLDAITRQLPQGFYSTFRTYASGTRVIGLKAHLSRLYRPATRNDIAPSADITKLRKNLRKILNEYPDEARIRVMMAYDGRIYAAVEPMKPLPPEIYQQGVKVITTDLQRQTPRLKSTRFIAASDAVRELVKGSQVFEALLVKNGRILEGMTSNFFYYTQGALGTARKNILLGVTRQAVLRVARGSGFRVVYRSLKQEQVPSLDEAFLTSSSRGIVPIVQIDGMRVGRGTPGNVTRRLMGAYRDYVQRIAEQI